MVCGWTCPLTSADAGGGREDRVLVGGGVKVGKAHVFLLQEELWVQLRLEAMAWRWTPNVND